MEVFPSFRQEAWERAEKSIARIILSSAMKVGPPTSHHGIPDRIGFTQAAASGHCVFPASQTADVAAFVDKFLLGKTSTNTAIAKTPYNTSLARWITWTTPTLQ
jgi:hypothetical protein